MAVIDFARNIIELEEAHSTEFSPALHTLVIALISEWQDRAGSTEERSKNL